MGATAVSVSRSIRLGGETYPIVLPTLRDPRLHSAAVIFSLQVLGQTTLHFPLSIAQILAALITCAVLEVVITFRQQRIIMWPASALLTGNSVAFILRAVGTRPGDWWSVDGVSLFVVTAAVSLLSKYTIRVGNRHIFNPSNFGLVACLLFFGSQYTNPQDLWWGPMTPGLVLTLGIIVVGGLLVVRELRMLPMVIAFWIAFAAFVGIIAEHGHCISARWHNGPICGSSFWTLLISSPEILVFIFFMMTDPKTAPRGQWARAGYGVSLAFVTALLVAPWRTEFATKVAFLSGLVVICALLPLVDRYFPAPGSMRDRVVIAPLVRRGALWFAALSLCTLLLQATANIGARWPSALEARMTIDQSLLASRPSVAIDPATIPTMTVNPKVREFAPAFTDETARQMTRDVVEDLVIEADALKTLNPRLASTALIGSRLRAFQESIESARTVGQTVVPSYRFRQITIVLISNFQDAQSPPQIGVRLTGTVHLATYATSSPQHVISESDSPCDTILTAASVGAHYLIRGEIHG